MPTIVLADANPAKIRKYQNRTRSRNPEFLAFEHYLRHERQEAVEYLSTGAVAQDGYICAPVAGRCDGKRRKGLLPTCSAAHIGRYMVKRLAVKYGMAWEVMHPHSFRHMFAKAFVAKRKDIAMLADLLGHASIATTRVYLRQSAREQAAMVDRLVTW